ncbi:inositol monophosphatase [Streptacidiphilus sp. P02-A3a]|uniref:inositol monophosphatase family protein n=1 Tax=Streptacidiphilus sp. P02-A3a TaxID=2704468 RepID=UPI0015F86FE7|nr:inositol monophosphatase [Streptacidiphilus sp. P02-A3a]QMU69646.1 inositol monophosphatase [Streptacidiphilus sp. P02-A3a]
MTASPSRVAATASTDDSALLSAVVRAAVEAGRALEARYSVSARPADRAAMFRAGTADSEVSLAILRPALTALRPDARWLPQEYETTALPPGEWWVVDEVEGNVNHVHGLPEWAVSVALVRDGEPVLAVVRRPVGDLTYTALRGGGAQLNGAALRVSAKRELDAAIVDTGQAEADQEGTYERIGRSVAAMLHRALLVRVGVPSTFPMLLVAAGHHDVFWQYEPTLPGVAAGALMITEAGGIVTRVDGAPWSPGSDTVLASAPGLHAAAVQVLAPIS